MPSTQDPSPPDLDPIISLLTTYNELNPSLVDEFIESPSALEFMRYVARNRPFVVRGGARDWEATRTWNVETLKRLLEGQSVNVAVTPKGNADSPTLNEEGELLFVKPHEEQQPFDEFVDYVSNQERSGDKTGEVRYAQTQNDNLRNEYSTLFSHVDQDIPWARIALEQNPEAINLWIGNSRSVTALHKDNYENIYVQIIGAKHFLLLPPLFYACVAEAELPAATYVRDEKAGLVMKEDGGGEKVPFATWDPDGGVEGSGTRYSRLAEPVRVTLEKGDMLYLPALWSVSFFPK
ncbi:related to phospholipase [Phialocephala subalpina]|uniref:Related to phospholipase n=1 Tax=Phialocephala subalpina TaxID=576137 RepID=A0A1L7WX86_9HELO|nr:related to phospholipase [Phialocephala subalpina]